MKKLSYCLLALVLLTTSCASKKALTAKNSGQTATTGVRDGSTMEKAIIIQATKDLAGVSEEYAWIAKNYPGAKTQGQQLIHKGKNSYDILKIVTADGTAKSLFFDITNSFGKF